MSTSAKNHSTEAHNRRDGHTDKKREYTPQQHAAVKRIMSYKSTQYYEILSIERNCEDIQIKKAYRKVSLTVHPDKNGAPQADEAFKRVSKAFQVLSDPHKKRIFDQTGNDPDDRTSAASAASSMFGGARGRQAAGQQFAADFDPNDIFNMFFGGQQFGGFGGQPFGGTRVYTFGGPGGFFQTAGNPQAARGGAQRAGQPANENPSWTQYIPIIGILLIFLISNLFNSGEAASSIPSFSYTQDRRFTQARSTPNYHVKFFVNPRDTKNLSAGKLRQLDRYAETTYISNLRDKCNRETVHREQLLRNAQGWFSRDEEQYQQALNMPLRSCERLDDLLL